MFVVIVCFLFFVSLFVVIFFYICIEVIVIVELEMLYGFRFNVSEKVNCYFYSLFLSLSMFPDLE